MTVDQLIEKLVELAQRGRSDWEVKLQQPDRMYDGIVDVGDIYCEDQVKQVVIDWKDEIRR